MNYESRLIEWYVKKNIERGQTNIKIKETKYQRIYKEKNKRSVNASSFNWCAPVSNNNNNDDDNDDDDDDDDDDMHGSLRHRRMS